MAVTQRPVRKARPSKKQLLESHVVDLSDDDDASQDETPASAAASIYHDESLPVMTTHDNADDAFTPAGGSDSGPESDFELNEIEPEDEDEDVDVQHTPATTKGRKPGRWAKHNRVTPGGMRHSRGVNDPRLKVSNDAIRLSLFGADKADQDPAVRHMFRWRKECVLPSRQADRGGAGGYMRSLYQSDARRELEMANDWTWYDHKGGKQALLNRQSHEIIDSSAARSYLPGLEGAAECILGPHDSPNTYSIDVGDSLDLGLPFSRPDVETERGNKRHGWLLNLGERVHQAEWAPNKPGQQYIAVTTMPMRNPAESATPGGTTHSSFRPQPSGKSALQIWQIGADDKNRPGKPELCQVMCTDWGDIKSIKWCPVPRKDDTASNTLSLGLLALVCGDGAVRILDVTIPSQSNATTFHLLHTATFTSFPPSGIYTTVTWLSSHSIAAGTSLGYLSIFSLTSSLISSAPPVPLVHAPLHPTYLAALTTCYPSRPHMLAATSAFGAPSLTDLTRINPAQGFHPGNTVYGPRSRRARQVLVWHDWSQMLLTSDDTGTLHGIPLRRFFSLSGLSRLRSTAAVLAVSECHPFVAAGIAGGEIVTMNVMRRALAMKGVMWVLRWFRHEWRRGGVHQLSLPDLTGEDEQDADGMDVDEETDNTNKARDSPMDDGRDRIRITEGFKAEQVTITRGAKDEDGPEGPLVTTHEMKTAITAVAWNPNLHCGGWITAGMGSGLLRIEDVGMDRNES